MDSKIKILVCGDVNGKFKTLFNRIETLNSKSGPFDLLLCAGNFFGEDNSSFIPYQNGTLAVPVPTYILGPVKKEQEKFYNDLAGCELGPNITYLGQKGLFTASGSLKIAYLSGLQADSQDENPYGFNESDVNALKLACIRGQTNYRGVDILLTTQWPSFITNLDDTCSKKYKGSQLLAWLTAHIRPRYLISGYEDIFYERKPYRNRSKTDDNLEVATRFLGLASVGNKEKHKWLYALSLTPVEKMRMTELCQRTTDETEFPFPNEFLNIKTVGANQKLGDSQVQFFYDMNAPQEDRKHRRSDKHHHNEKRQKIEFDQTKCWFCLGSPQVQKHLVISIGSECYLALAKGGLVSYHLLIIPITHHQSLVELSDDMLEEINRFKAVLTKCFLQKNEIPIFFERNFKTSHLQIQVVPIPLNKANLCKDAFFEEAIEHQLELKELPADKRIQDVMPKGVPYFMVELPENEVLYTKVRGNFPLQFGREVLASTNILDMPERVNWQECNLNEKEEIATVQNFRKMFEPFDFTL